MACAAAAKDGDPGETRGFPLPCEYQPLSVESCGPVSARRTLHAVRPGAVRIS
jgi:hypothetical protein